MSGEKGSTKEKETVCRVAIQQCMSADLRFDTDNPQVSIQKGMVVFVCFLQTANKECIGHIVKSILNVKLCELEEGSSRVSVTESNFDVLVIPQATLGGKMKGKTVQYHGLVSKTLGEELFLDLVKELRTAVGEGKGVVKSGVYGARQILKMETNGPYTHIFEF